MKGLYEYTPLYYGTPCQVRFYEAADGYYRGGIAYHDFIICGCCGAVLKTDDVVAEAEKAGIHWDHAVIEYGEWVDLSDTIRGA
jgi:hypothetical protein